MKKNLILFLFIIMFISISTANEVVLIEENELGKVVFKGQQNYKIGGFSIELHYPSSNTLENVKGNPNFFVVDYINNSAGVAIIEGFALKEYDQGTTIELASFTYAGDGQFSVIVRKLFDWNTDTIECKNLVPYSPSAEKETSLPEYQQPDRYKYPVVDAPSETISPTTMPSTRDKLPATMPLRTPETTLSKETPKNENDFKTDSDEQMKKDLVNEGHTKTNEHVLESDGADTMDYIPSEKSSISLVITLLSVLIGVFIYSRINKENT